MDNCPSYNLALSNILEHFLGLLHVWAEQCYVTHFIETTETTISTTAPATTTYITSVSTRHVGCYERTEETMEMFDNSSRRYKEDNSPPE